MAESASSNLTRANMAGFASVSFWWSRSRWACTERRSQIEVAGRRFVWYVHGETHIRIASEDKRFVVAYRWLGEPELTVSGSEFPRLAASAPRPFVLRPPEFSYRSPAGLARQIIRWAFSSPEQPAHQSEI